MALTLALTCRARAVGAAVAGVGVLDQTQTDGKGVWLVALAYLTVTPIIHDAHHNSNEALASLGLRVALPGAGAMIGFFAGGCGLLGGGCPELDVGAAAGLVGVVLIDAALLAWENVPSSAAQKSSAGGLQPRMRTRRATCVSFPCSVSTRSAPGLGWGE